MGMKKVGQGVRAGFRMCEEVVIISGLSSIQCVLGLYTVFLTRILSVGVDPLFVVALASITSAVVLLPFAVAFDRKKWTTKCSTTLVVQFVLIGFGGVTIFQVLMMQGIEKTSPAIASAMPNLAPGLIFIIAACLRMEKFERKCKFTRSKILGSLVCLSGAMAMIFLQTSTWERTATMSGLLVASISLLGWLFSLLAIYLWVKIGPTFCPVTIGPED